MSHILYIFYGLIFQVFVPLLPPWSLDSETTPLILLEAGEGSDSESETSQRKSIPLLSAATSRNSKIICRPDPLPRLFAERATSRIFFSELGLPNLGNTCFANSVHKLLSRHPHILNWTEETYNFQAQIQSQTEEENQEKLQLKGAFYLLFSSINRAKEYTLNPAEGPLPKPNFDLETHQVFDRFEDYLATQNPDQGRNFGYQGRFRRDQMDAAEYMLKVMDSLDYSSFFSTFKDYSQIFLDSSEIRPVSGGAPTVHLTLDLNRADITSINDAVAAYFFPYRIQGVQNEKTGLKEDGWQLQFLAGDPENLPQHLFLTLNRFIYDLKLQAPLKIRRQIKIPEKLKVPFYENEERLHLHEMPSLKDYYPIAIIVHNGFSPNSGHYRAYLREKRTSTWTLHDDLRVQKLPSPLPSRVLHDLEHNGYVFLYEAI